MREYGDLTPEQKRLYAGYYILKKLFLRPKEGGEEIPVLAPENAPIEDVLDHLHIEGLVEIKRKRLYKLTAAGKQRVEALIEEAAGYINQYQDEELEDVVEDLERRNLDAFRVRFLWDWYEGEFDDVVLFQQRRGFSDIEPVWQHFIMDDRFYKNLALELDID